MGATGTTGYGVAAAAIAGGADARTIIDRLVFVTEILGRQWFFCARLARTLDAMTARRRLNGWGVK
jgi:hypothetical protein